MSVFSNYVMGDPDLDKDSDGFSLCAAAIESGDWDLLERSYDVSDDEFDKAVKEVDEYIKSL